MTARSPKVVDAAIRLIQMEPDDKEAALAKCSDEMRKNLEDEMSAIQWFLLHFLVWAEQGSLEQVIVYCTEVAGPQMIVDAAADAA